MCCSYVVTAIIRISWRWRRTATPAGRLAGSFTSYVRLRNDDTLCSGEHHNGEQQYVRLGYTLHWHSTAPRAAAITRNDQLSAARYSGDESKKRQVGLGLLTMSETLALLQVGLDFTSRNREAKIILIDIWYTQGRF